ncbi:molybdate ABC transporter substrate-binding protein [Actinokineospora globicatena]|uniref:molybdate ABC transporter substrate-binding protein n=1 Tax=Actinokineospora globicatena TaxID=103729 RepID=UPI0020A41F10|nr:molybdate ABC transporter substrate-binding protein [Actinokineospora globicatena]MCP2302352.1 molybdate transport system substrate-binding protein [Actinokineospora globicatena]GLW75976.1 molybdate-binding protein [Actinokineospora globicatena]GLW82815.1 molybdate-binding protein [Actinokineospora globicatena]
MRALLLTVLLVLAGCSSQEEPPRTVTVFAAASLTEAFTTLGKEFETANPGVQVAFNFAGSSALAQQINQGAPADVFASAAPANMQQVGDAKEPVTFAKNQLEIAVPKGNPGKVTGLANFADESLDIALCAEQVPCGAAAKKALAAAGITAKPDTLEQDVKAALTKVRLGEVDAALVYRTDVKAAGAEVEGIDFPEAAKAVNDYPIAVLGKAPNSAQAKAFVDFVRSDRGKAVLAEAGFSAP